MKISSEAGLYLKSFVYSALLAPALIQLHEIAGHWLPARLLGARNLAIGYCRVNTSSTDGWPPFKRVMVHAGGPLVTNLLIWAGLEIMKSGNTDLCLAGWGTVLSAYRGLISPSRQLVKQEGHLKTDETLVAEALKISPFLISIPEFCLSLYFITTAYRRLPPSRFGIALSGFAGMAVGTIAFIKFLGPLIWPAQEGTPELNSLGLCIKKNKKLESYLVANPLVHPVDHKAMQDNGWNEGA